MFIQVELTPELIHKCFEGKTHQADVIINLYKLVFPNWDNIRKINGWPKISPELNDRLFRSFIDFDKKHHPDVLYGGAWMNNGFSSEKGVAEFTAIFEGEIVYKWDKVKLTHIAYDKSDEDDFTMVQFSRIISDHSKTFYHCTKASYKRLMRILNHYPLCLVYNDCTRLVWNISDNGFNPF